MLKRLFVAALAASLGIIFSFGPVQRTFCQESGEEPVFIIEEDIDKEFITGLAQEPKSRFVTSEELSLHDVEPAINYYIRSDINRKFSGLITNLRLEKIYGILQEGKTASVFFDYSYTSIRNRDNVLYEKGKMTFIKFNSGRWFNAELSIFLMDSYPVVTMDEPNKKEE